MDGLTELVQLTEFIANPIDSTTYIVEANLPFGGCESIYDTIQVNVMDPGTLTMLSSNTICEFENFILSPIHTTTCTFIPH